MGGAKKPCCSISYCRICQMRPSTKPSATAIRVSKAGDRAERADVARPYDYPSKSSGTSAILVRRGGSRQNIAKFAELLEAYDASANSRPDK
jgi:hypothetical protein